MIFLFILLTIVLLSIVILAILSSIRRRFLVPEGNVMYMDSKQFPGETLYSVSMPLVGKPDFILKKGEQFIPIEIKRGKTPSTPYKNHVAQLYAYCLLVEEKYGIRPPYGILKYPSNEFKLEFPIGIEDKLNKTVLRLVDMKNNGYSRQNLTRVCKVCREHDNN